MLKNPFRKALVRIPGLLFLALLSACCGSDPDVSDFCSALKAGNRILEDPDWYNWGVAPVYGKDGKVHAMVCRWPAETSMIGWLTRSEIAHAVSDRPEGPYRITGTVLGYTGEDSWDQSCYNPNIHKIGDRYVMLYAGRRRQDENIVQQIGMALANSPGGPWTRSKNNPVVSFSGVPGSWNCLHASNPSLVVCPDGSFRIYYKGISDASGPRLRTIGVAVSDNLEGPYTDHPDNPLISYVDKKGDVEDPYAFYYKGKYYMILEDRMGVAREGTAVVPADNQEAHAGGIRPGLLYTSDDGLSWDLPKIGYQTNDFYFDEKRERFERPQILWKDGQPDYLFLALKGGRFNQSSGAILKIIWAH